MVRMFMRINHRVGQANPLAQQLVPQIGRRIDQQGSLRKPDRQPTSGPIVLRIRALTYGAVASNDRNADTRPGAQEDQLAT